MPIISYFPGGLGGGNLAHLWEKVQTALSGKQDKLTPDESIKLQDGGIGVALPVQPVTRAEYEALTEEEKQADRVYLVESSVSDVPGFGGFVPPGAIIPFIGLHAPLGYLACDGAEYEAAAYPALAEYFREQFGAVNHFGGDGTNTFAVPDMRNLFLRGYHGAAEEQLSGEVGARQEATKHLNIYASSQLNFAFPTASLSGNMVAENVDTREPPPRLAHFT